MRENIIHFRMRMAKRKSKNSTFAMNTEWICFFQRLFGIPERSWKDWKTRIMFFSQPTGEGKKKWIAKFPFYPHDYIISIISHQNSQVVIWDEFKVNREYRWGKLETLITRLINFSFIMSRIKHRRDYFFTSTLLHFQSKTQRNPPNRSPSQQPPHLNVDTV